MPRIPLVATLVALALAHTLALPPVARAQVGWHLVTVATTQDLHAVITDPFFQRWLVGDGGTIMKSVDNGSTWTAMPSGTSAGLRAMYTPSSSNYWVAGSGGTVRVSTDNGATWPNESPGTGASFEAIGGRGSGVAYAVGEGGAIWRSTDSGANWASQSSGTSARLYSVIGPTSGTSNVMLAVGEGGVIVKTTDGGASWSPKPSGTTENLYGAGFGGGGVIAVGANGTMILTVNAGETWTPLAPGTTADLHAVDDSGQNSAYLTAVGDGGTIIKSTSSGATWFPQYTPTTKDLRGVAAMSNAVQLAVGLDGTVLQTTDGGQDPPTVVAGVADAPLVGLRGEPNPFRTSTTLLFSLPERSVVRLTIHDAAGRVVRRLVEDTLAAGPHRAAWDGRSDAGMTMASGVYFSRLETGSRVHTEKVLLVR